jgi:undecaprenyl-diphosphatase
MLSRHHGSRSLGTGLAACHYVANQEATLSLLPQWAVRWSRAESRVLVAILTMGTLLLAFAIIAGEVLEGEPLAIDRVIMLAFRTPGNPADPIGAPWVEEMARDVTALGSFAVLAIVVGTVLTYMLLIGNRTAAYLLLASVLGGVLLNNVVKFAFARPRPDLVAPAARVFTLSFPSGHATLSAITYLTLGALLAHMHPSPRMRVFFMAVAVLLTFLVGISRIYLGVHYPTDVVAGWCIGAAWALACWIVTARLPR